MITAISDDPLTLMQGAIYLFVIPTVLGLVFWTLLRPIVGSWVARDVMASLRPDRRKVAAADRDTVDLHLELHNYEVIHP